MRIVTKKELQIQRLSARALKKLYKFSWKCNTSYFDTEGN